MLDTGILKSEVGRSENHTHGCRTNGYLEYALVFCATTRVKQ